MTHTPGPWFVANGNEVHDRLTRYDEHGARIGDTPNRIAVVEYPYMDEAGKTANANVIAAAPQMHEAVRLFQKFFDDMPRGQLGRIFCDIGTLNEALLTARAALAKAGGCA